MPLDDPPAGLHIAFVTLAVAGATVWAIILARIAQRRPVLRYLERREVPWSWPHVLAIVGGYFCLQIAAGIVVASAEGANLLAGAEEINPDTMRQLLQVSSCANFFFFAAGWVFLWLAAGAKPRDVGFVGSLVPTDLALGALSFLAMALPVFTLQAALTHFWPTEHPIIQLLEQESSHATLWAATIAAVFAAPIAEEFLFRVVIQGSLERVMGRRPRRRCESPERNGEKPVWAELRDDASTSDHDENPYARPRMIDQPDTVAPPLSGEDAPAGWAPIGITSLLFALLHVGNGPDPIPLFLLSLMLGYVYQRTHRILPCILVHMLLNGSSMMLLWSQVAGLE